MLSAVAKLQSSCICQRRGQQHERRTELVTPLSVTRSTSTDRVDMVPRFSGLNPGNTARAPVCRADVPRVPEQFPEAVTHSTGLRSRLAADRGERDHGDQRIGQAKKELKAGKDVSMVLEALTERAWRRPANCGECARRGS